MAENPGRCLYALVGIFIDGIANLRTDGLHHLLTVGTGSRLGDPCRYRRRAQRPPPRDPPASWRGLRHACRDSRRSSRSRRSGIHRTLRNFLSFGRCDKIRRAGAQILSLLTADTNLFHADPLVFLYQNTSAAHRTRLAQKPIPALTSPCNGRNKESGTPIHDENPLINIFSSFPGVSTPHYKSPGGEGWGLGRRNPSSEGFPPSPILIYPYFSFSGECARR